MGSETGGTEREARGEATELPSLASPFWTTSTFSFPQGSGLITLRPFRLAHSFHSSSLPTRLRVTSHHIAYAPPSSPPRPSSPFHRLSPPSIHPHPRLLFVPVSSLRLSSSSLASLSCMSPWLVLRSAREMKRSFSFHDSGDTISHPCLPALSLCLDHSPAEQDEASNRASWSEWGLVRFRRPGGKSRRVGR